MDKLRESIRNLEADFGEIDNIKLLLGAAGGMSTDSVICQILKTSEAYKNGDLRQIARFNDDSLLVE